MLSPGTGRPASGPGAAADTAARSRGAVEWAFEGLACAERGDHVGALHCFQHALETDIDCREAWLGLAEVFLAMHDGRRADACLRVGRLIERRKAPQATA
jgi:thioredoxin-like negative regulator of GroEL